MYIEVTVQGISPLLFNRFTAQNAVDVGDGTSSAFARSASKDDPREIARGKAYIDNDGTLFVPAENMFQTIINAGAFHKAGKSKLTTMKSSLIPAGVQLDEFTLSLNTKDFEVDVRSIVNPTTRGRSICYRPRVDSWQLSFTLIIDTKMFNAKLIRDVVDDAGSKIGLCDYTPRHRGPFGRFKVVRWVEHKEKPVADDMPLAAD